tara:strand:+ start:3782 stop:3952 length:171 start_codon:yes stop_codon:yes gene_type:complete
MEVTFCEGMIQFNKLFWATYVAQNILSPKNLTRFYYYLIKQRVYDSYRLINPLLSH